MMPSRVSASAAIFLFALALSVAGQHSAPSAILPIVEMREQCLIGGVQDHKWISANRFQQSVKSPHNFSLYTLQGPSGEVVLTKKPDSECHPTWTAKSAPKDGIAISSPSWNVMPRLPKPLDVNDPAYVRIITEILKGAGIKAPQVKITQAYSVDLDGDGTDEVVIVANRFAKGLSVLSGISSEVSPGDYTLAVVRKSVAGKIQNIFIIKAVWVTGNDGPLPRENRLSAIADLNGDGVMELVFYSAYYEGSDSDVIQLNGTKTTDVLSCSCDH